VPKHVKQFFILWIVDLQKLVLWKPKK